MAGCGHRNRVFSTDTPLSRKIARDFGTRMPDSGARTARSGARMPSSGTRTSCSGTRMPCSGARTSRSGARMPSFGARMAHFGARTFRSGLRKTASPSPTTTTRISSSRPIRSRRETESSHSRSTSARDRIGACRGGAIAGSCRAGRQVCPNPQFPGIGTSCGDNPPFCRAPGPGRCIDRIKGLVTLRRLRIGCAATTSAAERVPTAPS